MEPIYIIKPNNSIKVTQSDGWLLVTDKSDYKIETGRFSLFLLSLLEHDYQTFHKWVIQNNEAKNLWGNFPLLELLKYPFHNKRDYWAGLALNWIEGSSSGKELGEWAKSIETSWMPQKLKHRFWKVFSQFTSSNHYKGASSQ